MNTMVYPSRFIYQAFFLVVQIHISLQSCAGVRKCVRFANGYCQDDAYVLECTGITDYSTVINRWGQQNRLHIYNDNIPEIQPGFLRRFLQLNELWMPQNNIHSLEAGAFSGLIHLNNLNLTRNKIESVSKGIFNGMYELSVLDLSHNLIANIDSKSFAGTDSLTALYLNDNRISGMVRLTDHCSNLKVLDLSNNKIEQLQFANNCSKLDTLNVAGNALDRFPKDISSKIIKSLDLSSNNLSHIESSDLYNFNALEELNLSRNPLFEDEDAPVDLFQNVHSLKALNLSYTSINKLRVGIFSGMLDLELLDLSSNNLTHLPRSIFHGLTNLGEVYISNNRLSYFDGDEFYKFNKLHKIGLNGNSWNCNLLTGILKKLGTAKVVRGSSYNTTNILGIACYEETKDFQEVDAYNSSDINYLQKEYLSHIIKTQTELRETFAQLKTFLEESHQNENNYSTDNSTNDILLDLEKVLKESVSHVKNIDNSVNGYKFGVDSLSVNLTNVFGLLQNVTNLITILKNETSLEKVMGIKTDSTAVQIAELKSTLMKFAKNYDTMQGSMLQTLIDIRNNLASAKIGLPASNEKLLQTAQTEAFKDYPPVTINRSDTIALYCMLIVQLAVFGLLAVWHYRRYKKFRTMQTEDNALNSLVV